MSFSFKKFEVYLNSRGLSLNQLRLKGVITQHAYEAMINDRPISVEMVAKICRHLNVPIEKVVEINYDDGLNSREDESY